MDPRDVTNLNQEDLFQELRALGFPVTRRMIKHAVLRREIIPVRLGVGNYFSIRDGLEWIESRRQSGIYRLPRVKAAK